MQHARCEITETISLSPEIISSVKNAIAEDLGTGDVTTNSIVPVGQNLQAKIIAKEPGFVAGIAVAGAAFQLTDQNVDFVALKREGEAVTARMPIAEICGPARAILSAERTALNFLGRMSGIATLTSQFVEQVRGTRARILDTRKTAPNLRACDKLAVTIGGGENHRHGLYDMILIKDSHIDFAGSLAEAVRRIREANSGLEIEVEVRTLPEVAQALDLGVRRLLLDNMALDDISLAVKLNQGRAGLEASGNVTLANVRRIAEIGVDYISVGALTHSAKVLDVSLMVEPKASTRNRKKGNNILD
jgi:nicotinate-nucleotide pyrophosphorylase (carboxylating)